MPIHLLSTQVTNERLHGQGCRRWWWRTERGWVGAQTVPPDFQVRGGATPANSRLLQHLRRCLSLKAARSGGGRGRGVSVCGQHQQQVLCSDMRTNLLTYLGCMYVWAFQA